MRRYLKIGDRKIYIVIFNLIDMELGEKNWKRKEKMFLQAKPFSWGEGNGRLSEEADLILYK